MNAIGREIEVNGRSYRLPRQPTVVVCIDGSEPGYIEAAVDAGRAPWFSRVLKSGTNLIADCVVPSFTNPNNLSIVTGRPPAVHGISGNYFLDPDTGREVMMNDPKFLRVETLFPAFQRAGCRIAVVTAKDKLRGLLGKGLELAPDKACSFSSEKSDKASLAENGIEDVNALVGMPVPEVYSAGLSEFVFAAGVRLMERDRPEIMYLSTTDYIQHKHAPGTPVANDFYAMMDGYMAKLDAMGCTIVLTADHGMNAKFDANSQPDVIYLQDLFDGWVGKDKARVILPITDPYVVHHGALGSYAVVYCDRPGEWAARLKAMPGIEVALTKEEAAKRFELPADRLGDLVVVSTKHKVLGTSAARHDLSGLTEPLRSHGGISEQHVPLICNRTLSAPANGRHWRNFDAFDLALNLVA
ncbi:phosphonoacetate hydrolase [Reyranella sp.]|uniref:phosphonoacetate hydrolase n=1 Tax=Reyranella sp. TaxID=1929291 RepID=UPI003D0F32AF